MKQPQRSEPAPERDIIKEAEQHKAMLDPKNKDKIDLVGDIAVLSAEKMSESGDAPDVRYGEESDAFQPMTKDEIEESLPEEANDKYPKWVLEVEDVLPEGCTKDHMLEFKDIFGFIYITELASGTYVYRPLLKKEHDKLKQIEGITRDALEQRISCLCVLAPKIDMLEIKNGLSGTATTLTDNILRASDFGVVDVQPLKL